MPQSGRRGHQRSRSNQGPEQEADRRGEQNAPRPREVEAEQGHRTAEERPAALEPASIRCERGQRGKAGEEEKAAHRVRIPEGADEDVGIEPPIVSPDPPQHAETGDREPRDPDRVEERALRPGESAGRPAHARPQATRYAKSKRRLWIVRSG